MTTPFGSWIARCKPAASVLMLVSTGLASGCGPAPAVDPGSTRSPSPARQAAPPVMHGVLRTQDVGLGARDAVVFLKGCTRTGTTDTCVDLTPSAQGAVVQVSDNNRATFRGSDYVLSFPSSTDMSKPQQFQAKATGYISANGKVKLNASGPSYVRVKLYATGTKAGGTLNAIGLASLSNLSVAAGGTEVETVTLTGGTQLVLALRAANGPGADDDVINPTVNVIDPVTDTGTRVGTITQRADGAYVFSAGNIAGTFTISFDAGEAHKDISVTIGGFQQSVTLADIPLAGLTISAIDLTTNSTASVKLPQGVAVTNALGQPLSTVTITMTPLATPFLVQGLHITQVATIANADNLGPAYDFGPTGTHFSPPVTVSLSYDAALVGLLSGIGGRLTPPLLPHHRAYGSVHGGSGGLNR